MRVVCISVLLLAMASTLTSCSQMQPIGGAAPTASAQLPTGVPKAEPTPWAEPISARGNPVHYSVYGVQYFILDTAVGYKEQGIASWYGKKFHGKLTSNGEVYDMYAYSAAHKTLPLPSYAKVTNLENGKQVVVRINDRGPFVKNRLIDLSYTAAEKIGMIGPGTARVEVETIAFDRAGKLYEGGEINADQNSNLRCSVNVALQVGAFASQSNAYKLQQQMQDQGFENVAVVVVEDGSAAIHKVMVGALDDPQAMEQTLARLSKAGYAAHKQVVARQLCE